MNVIFIGASSFGLKCLEATYLMEGVELAGVISNDEKFSISYNKQGVTNVLYSDFSVFATKQNIPFYKMEKNMQEQELHKFINNIKPDLIIVVGWYHLIPESILSDYLCIGMHASLLPDYSGGAPLVWAIINGERETGITLFRLDEGVDDGDIISQEKIKIEEDDSIKEVYEKVTVVSKKILLNALQNSSSIVFTPQDKSKLKIYPQRKPDDGELNLTKSSKELYDFIRAQSSPYPGAFIRTIDGKKLIIEKARIQE